MRGRHHFGLAISVAAAIFLSGCVSTSIGTPKAGNEQAELHTQLAWNYLQRRQYRVAQDEIKKALRADPNNSKGHHIYGLLLTQTGEHKKAESHFRRAIQSDPTNLDAQEDFAGYLCQTGRGREAIERYKATMENPLNQQPALTRTRAGLCHLADNNFAAAEPYFREALKISPSIKEALAGMLRISFERGNFMSARGYAERYVGQGDPSPDVLLYAARTEARLGDAKTAADYARQLRILFPESEQALAVRAKQVN